MSILKRWYRGDLYPGEEIVPLDAEYRAVGRKIGDEREYFKTNLSPEDAKRFEKWDGLLLESSSMNSYANFSYGFRLGATLMREVFLDNRPSN